MIERVSRGVFFAISQALEKTIHIDLQECTLVSSGSIHLTTNYLRLASESFEIFVPSF